MDDFFTTLENVQPYLKLGLLGFSGGGKTLTMVKLAIGLRARIGSKKPIAYFDTETGGMKVRRVFEAAGMSIKTDVLYKPSRTLADLTEVMRRGREGAFDILLIDSISHVYESVLNRYMKMKNKTRMGFEDWNVIKPKWKEEFSDPFVNDKYHAIMCGRAGFTYEDEKVEQEDGKIKREIYKTGIKMKAESETAYEPDILILMERREEILDKDNRKVWREATVLKDRSQLIDGKTFKNPDYESFAPAVDYLLENPVEREAPPESDEKFDNDEAKKEFARRRDVLRELIAAELDKSGLSAQTAEVKKARVELLEASFGTAAKTEIENMHPDRLGAGLEVLKKLIAERASVAA